MGEKEAKKYLEYAEMAIQDRDYEDAKKNILKSLNYHVSEKAYQILEQCNKLIEGGGKPPHKKSNAGESSTQQKDEEGKESSQESSPLEPEDKKETAEDNDNNLICEDILSKKDYYEILGIEKTASDEEIKKQYKKLALKLHPDKNRSPKSTEAFKKVTQAFSCLSNKEKRKIYDEHGNEEGFRTRYREYFADEDEIDPEEFFEYVFYGRSSRNRRGRRPQHVVQENGKWFMILQFLPIIIMLLVSMYMNFSSSYSSPGFSLETMHPYTYRRITTNLEIPYYVKPTDDMRLLDYYDSPEFERKVLDSYREKLDRECKIARNRRFQLEDAKKEATNQDEVNKLEDEIHDLDFNACEQLKDF